MFSINEGLLIQTQLNGFYTLIGSALSKFSTEADSQLLASSVYRSHCFSDGNFAIGTVSNGVFIINNEGK
jgi:hypothetical protein